MKILVIGAGMMGSAAAYDLSTSPGVTAVVLADIDVGRAAASAKRFGAKVTPLALDTADRRKVVEAMRGVDGVIGATSYTHNVALTEAAIEAGKHFCDLGGNMDVVYTQVGMNAAAEKAGVLIVPNCGLAPGMACVIAAGAAERFSRLDSLTIRVGGLPLKPEPPLDYQLVFAPEGLINEYIEPAEAIKSGRDAVVPGMQELESLAFPAPFEKLEAFSTSGGTSTLTRMFKGRVQDLDYKTIRYPGHCEKFRLLLELGFGSSEPFVYGNSTFTAREMFEALLRKRLPANGPDVVLVRVSLTGELKSPATPSAPPAPAAPSASDGSTKTLAYELVDYYDNATRMTSMMRTTAYPTSAIIQMAVDGTISRRGVAPPEQCVPLAPFMEALRKRKINFKETLT
jgi:lysine 6-dehydrogenase